MFRVFGQLLFLIFIVQSPIVFAKNKCESGSVLKLYSLSIQNIEAQTEKVNKILSGKSNDGFVIREIFGSSFELTQTNSKIDTLKQVISMNSGVLPEQQNLSFCLEELKYKTKLKTLQEKSLALRELEIKLLEKKQALSDSLRESDLTESSLPSLKERIDKDSEQASGLKAELESDLLKKQKEALKQNNDQKREFLSYESELTKIKIEMLNQKIQINKNLEEKIRHFEKSNDQLKALSNNLDIKDRNQLINSFKQVEELWLSLSRGNYADLFNFTKDLTLPQVPELIKSSNTGAEYQAVVVLREKLIELRKEIVKGYSDKKNYELKLLNQLVTSSNALRTRYFNKLGVGYFFDSVASIKSYKLFKNEIVNAPYRIISFFYSKFLFLKEQISLGKEGYVRLSGKLFLFLLFVIAFFILRLFFNKLKVGQDRFFESLLRKHRGNFFVRKSYSLWYKTKDISIPIFWLIILMICQHFELFKDTYIAVKIAEVYLGAIILKTLLTTFLGSVSRLDTSNFFAFKKKAEETSSRFKNIFTFYFYTMILFEVTVGRVYLYQLVNIVVLAYSVYALIKECTRWEKELTVYAEKKFSGVIVEKYLAFTKFIPSYFRAIFILLFNLSFMFFDIFVSLTENFEIAKKISANLFKKQIEKVEAEADADTKIPQSYKDYFSPRSLEDEAEYVPSAYGLEEKIENEINEWKTGLSDEHTAVVYGDKGIGKTTLLKRVTNTVSEDAAVEVIYTKIPSKTTDVRSLYAFLSNLFETEIKDGPDIYEVDKTLEKKMIIVLDEAQNIFLSQTGGFDAYYVLTKTLNFNTENIFWVLSFNKYSWLYLDRAFGRTQFFRNVFEVKGWTDNKIKELIMKRHKKANFKLSFDLLINATKSQDEIDKYASVESKFFKLLWEMSRGNPRSALFLWVSALSRKNFSTFNVNIPKEADFDGVEKLADDLMFVIAHVLKHENLTSSEIIETTTLPEGIVRNAIRHAIEKKYFFKDERRRYMVDISTQYGLIRYLRLKNFIYGS